MQEKSINKRNISKKKSENIKIPKKIQEKMKENPKIATSYNYKSKNSTSNNNSILINKPDMKIDLGKNYKTSNLRSISHSTKCMMKVKCRNKERENDKYQPLKRTKKKLSLTKEKKVFKPEYSNKSKKSQNTKDILINKKYNYDFNNHSFNSFRKSKNQNNNNNNNNSLRNIESSSYSDFYYPNKMNNMPKNIKNEQNLHKNNFILPFFYCEKKGEKKSIIKKKIHYSDKNDYSNILQNINNLSLEQLASKIVALSERKWLNEIKDNSALIEKNKSINFESNILNEFIKGRLAIQEDFNWLLWAVSYVFQNKIIINNNSLNQEGEKKINFNSIDDINNIFSVNDIDKWKKGFIYNGVYFCLLDKIDNYNEIKIIKREIKSLNLLFLDYIQLLDNVPANINETKSLISNNILFPLLNIAELSFYYIYASMALEPNFIEKKIDNTLNEEDYLYNYYNEIDLSNYYINNLKNSPFFANLTENNLLNLNNGKFLLVNIAKDLHPLLLPKNVENDCENINENDYINYIFLKYPLITNKIKTEDNFFNKSSFIVYFKYFINYLICNKYITDIPSLEYEMNKFGINKCFYLLILSRIKFNNSCDIETNNNISSLIKIYILVKFLTKIEVLQLIKNKNNKNIDEEKSNDSNNSKNNNCISTNNKNNSNDIEKENKSETSCGTENAKINTKKNVKFNTEKKNDLNTIYINFNEIFNKDNQANKNIYSSSLTIKTISQLILFILSPKSSSIEINTDDLVRKLLNQSKIYLENFKKLSNRLFSNDVNTLYDYKDFLKSLIISARKNPLIFLRQIENKFNILFNYEIKYCSSICIENFIKYFNESQIIENDPKIISYINGEELGFYLIIKNISTVHQKNKTNYFKKKGNKMIKNISSDNMDIYNCKYNYDNLSILNRSIIQPRNSNFKILNSSKDKPKIKSFNNISMASVINSNSNNKNYDLNKINHSKSKENTNLLESNNSGINSNSGSLNINSNESNTIINKNILNSYKSNKNQSNSNFKSNDNMSVADNCIIISSTSNDIFEFNYGEEDSEKSFNISYGGDPPPTYFNKKRNTTNVNNSKFNLNTNRTNNSGNNCKTINAKNNNISSNICLNNIVINSKNPINNLTPSCSSGANNNYNKIFFGTENNEQFWRILFNNYHLKFPYNLYKVTTQNFKSSLLIYRYLSMHYSFFPFFNNNMSFIKNQNKDNLKNSNSNPEINISEMLNEQKLILEKIFSDIISINSRSCYTLINFYFYYFINYYFVEKNQLNECEKIMEKINHIFENKIIYKLNNYNIIISLLNTLLNDKRDFLKTYNYSCKALILSLIQYGEPRGRNNDGNNIMIFPAWKTGRNFMFLDNNDVLNENFKELYHCLYYLNDNKRCNKLNLNDIKDYKLIDKNIINDLFRNIEYIKKIFKKNQKIKKKDELNSINSNNINNPFDKKSSSNSIKNNYKKNNSGEQKLLQSINDDTFFNFDDEEMLERPSQVNNLCDEFLNINEENNESIINAPKYSNNMNNNFIKKNSINNQNNNNNSNSNYINNNANIIPSINSEWAFDIYFKENSTFPDIIFPSMSDKKPMNQNYFFTSEKFFIYFVKALFAIINFSQSDVAFTNDYLKKYIFTYNSIFGNNNNFNNSSSNSTPKQKKPMPILTKMLSDNLYYKKYSQSNILVSFGNNAHCETGHKGYKFLSLPRVLYPLKNKEIISVKSGWEHSIVQDKEKMLYSWGNNSCCQCGFEPNENINGNIIFPKNIPELNDKNIIEISCGNEHTLALNNRGEVYSWGSISDGVLGREIPQLKPHSLGVATPGKINFFIKNNIKIRHISSGSIHNLCLDDKSNLYSFGCSKGGQLGIDENELSIIYKQNKNKNNLPNKEDKNFSISEPQLIKSLKDIEIIKISSGEAHNAALSVDGKCYVWGFGSNGQLGLGFCEDYFPSGEGMHKSRVFTPTVVKEFDKNNIRISKVFCGKTFTIFLNKKDELFSTGINDLNQCGVDSRTITNEYLCDDIVSPIKIEMFMRMKIINVSCGESHVLAITEDHGIKTLFSWGSNRFGQLGQGIQTKQSMPKIVNYFLHYNYSEVYQVSCGAFHSLTLLRRKNEENINSSSDEKYILNCIDKCEDYLF